MTYNYDRPPANPDRKYSPRIFIEEDYSLRDDEYLQFEAVMEEQAFA